MPIAPSPSNGPFGFPMTIKPGHCHPGSAGFPLCTLMICREFTNGLVRTRRVTFPMYQSEAMVLSFSRTHYPFAVKVAAGKIDAITGAAWSPQLIAETQNYLVLPTQP